jgi:hypothetical protein
VEGHPYDPGHHNGGHTAVMEVAHVEAQDEVMHAGAIPSIHVKRVLTEEIGHESGGGEEQANVKVGKRSVAATAGEDDPCNLHPVYGGHDPSRENGQSVEDDVPNFHHVRRGGKIQEHTRVGSVERSLVVLVPPLVDSAVGSSRRAVEEIGHDLIEDEARSTLTRHE